MLACCSDWLSSRERVSALLENVLLESSPGSGLVVVKRNAIQLQPVIDQLVAELAGDFGLQLLDLLRGELDHRAVAQIDQMVVVAVAHLLVTGTALAEIVPLDDA